MKSYFILLCAIAIIATLVPLVGYSQYSEDALRLSMPGVSVGARALGLGMAYTGVANDFSAVYWNPAGLGQMRLNEISFGLSHLSATDESAFYGNTQSFTNSATGVNSFGMVYPFPTTRGSLVFALGYGRQADFTTGLSFKGFNPKSSIIPFLNQSLAYELFLVDQQGNTPLVDSLQQSGKVIEGGGINYWTVAGAVEAAKQLYLGLTLNFISGSYTYNRNYSETDIANKYTLARFDTNYAFSSLNLINTIDGDVSGFTAKIGLLYKFRNNSRVGFSVKLPSYYTVKEAFATDGSSSFDVPDTQGVSSYRFIQDGRNEYDVASPFVFTGGLSIAIQDLMLSGDLEFTDWTQMEFRNADQQLLSLNTQIKELFQPTVNIRVGAEYEFNTIGMRLRGGFAYLPSPYNGDPVSFAQKYITGGAGFIVENSIGIDVGYARGFRDSYRVNYNDFDANGQPTSKTTETIKTNNVIATVSYRF